MPEITDHNPLTIEIYFEDLNQDAQKLYGKALCGAINTSSPIAIIEVEDEAELCADCPKSQQCQYNQ